jgi:Cu/Ag efflux protein CusF
MKTGWLAIIITSLLRTNGFVLQQPRRLKMSHVLRDAADDIRFAAQFDPSQAAASLSIFFSFIVVQNRINNSNILLAKITDTKKELKTTKAEVLGGVNGAVIKRDTLEGKIIDLEAEWMNAITFVSIPGLTLRFRVPQQASQITGLQEKEDSEAIEFLETTNQSQLVEDKKEMKDFNGNIVASTATQRFLLFVGISCCMNAFIFCVHYLCLIGRVYMFT